MDIFQLLLKNNIKLLKATFLESIDGLLKDEKEILKMMANILKNKN